MVILDSVLQAVGETPVVRLNRIGRELPHTLLVKLEYLNPSGSVKDRMAIFMCEQAARRGELRPGGTIVENTSGNTGMALAMYAAVKGYQCVFTIPDKMSQEKINQLRAFGAEVVVCPYDVPEDHPEHYVNVAKRIAEERPGSFYVNQYHNQDNITAHQLTTGPEIWRQTEGKVDYIFIGAGTGGTLSGVGRFFKSAGLPTKIIGVDPEGSIFYDLFHRGEPGEPHPYQVEGIGMEIVCQALDLTVVDDFVRVGDRESFLMTRRLAREEGLYCGGSSGAAVSAMVRYMAEIEEEGPKVALAILPDHGSRYLSKIYNDQWMREHGYLD